MLFYIKEHWKRLANLGLFIIFLFIFFYLVKLSFNYASTIYFAMLFYALYRPCINFLHRKGFSYKFSVSVSIFLITLAIVGIFICIGTLLVFQTQNTFHNLPEWASWVENSINNLFDKLKSQISHVPDSFTKNAKSQINSYLGKIGEWSYGVVTTIFSNVSLITEIVAQIAIGYILSIFLAFEWPQLKIFLSKNTPENIKKFTSTVFGDTLKGLAGYIKAQLILVTCTFSIVCISLFILKAHNALLLAFVSGLLDFIPFVGVASFFFPWILYLALIGQMATALKLSILWTIIIIFRQVMEPRITGNSLGISPFIMLSGMVISVSVLGTIGIVFSPVILIVFKSLWEKGYFHLWILDKEKEEEKKPVN